MGGGMSFDLGHKFFGGDSPRSPTPDRELDGGGKPIEVINLRPKSEENFNISDFLKSLLPEQGSHGMGEYRPPPVAPPPPPPHMVAYSNPPVAPLLPPPMPPLMLATPDQYVDAYHDSAGANRWSNDWNIESAVIETPESPPCYEQESLVEPVEYNDRSVGQVGAGIDVDHRIAPLPPPPSRQTQDIDHRVKDIDHRNLISLTGSPGQRPSPVSLNPLPPPPVPPIWSDDQDYRDSDQDYRIPPVSTHNTPMLQSPGSMSNPPMRGMVPAPMMQLQHRLNGAPIRQLATPRFAPRPPSHNFRFHSPGRTGNPNGKQFAESPRIRFNIHTRAQMEPLNSEASSAAIGNDLAEVAKAEEKVGDNVESVDMEMSDEDEADGGHGKSGHPGTPKAKKTMPEVEVALQVEESAFDRLQNETTKAGKQTSKTQDFSQNNGGRVLLQTPEHTMNHKPNFRSQLNHATEEFPEPEQVPPPSFADDFDEFSQFSQDYEGTQRPFRGRGRGLGNNFPPFSPNFRGRGSPRPPFHHPRGRGFRGGFRGRW